MKGELKFRKKIIAQSQYIPENQNLQARARALRTRLNFADNT